MKPAIKNNKKVMSQITVASTLPCVAGINEEIRLRNMKEKMMNPKTTHSAIGKTGLSPLIPLNSSAFLSLTKKQKKRELQAKLPVTSPFIIETSWFSTRLSKPLAANSLMVRLAFSGSPFCFHLMYSFTKAK